MDHIETLKTNVTLFESEKDRCKHCDQRLARESQSEFCCHGCETAYQIINSLELENFYDIARANNLVPVQESTKERLNYLDAEEFREKAIQKNDDGTETARLDLQNLTCYACVWLVESAVRKLGPEQQARVNLSSGKAEITYSPAQVPLSRIATLIETLGYRVSASDDAAGMDRTELLRLGVAWFCFMNVMAIAFAEYLDPQNQIEDWTAQLFRGVSLVLTLPAVFYSARSFYDKAWLSLKVRQISIDQSISVSILTVFAYSVYTTLVGSGPVYFDSVCAGIALLLSARFFQSRLLQHSRRKIRSLMEPAENFVRSYVNGNESMISLASLTEGTSFRVLPGEWIPVAAEVTSGKGSVNLEPLTGEPRWQKVSPGARLISGAFNGESPLMLKALEHGGGSYWQDVVRSVDRMVDEKGRMRDFSDRAAFIFLICVNAMALALFVYFAWQGDFAEGARRAFALALIACPCAFGLTAPMVFSVCVAKGLHKGVLFKSPRSIEDLARAKRIVFDKTGTLTEGRMRVVNAAWNEENIVANNLSSQRVYAILDEMASSSHHAASGAVVAWLSAREHRATLSLPEIHVKEIFGDGMVLNAAEGEYRLGHGAFALQKPLPTSEEKSQIFFTFAGQTLAVFTLDDSLLPEAGSLVKGLKDLGRHVEILSGDSPQRTKVIADRLGITTAAAEARPEDKATRIREISHSDPVVMIGNGSNDSLAMAQAAVSIAVAHSTSVSRHAADVCLNKAGLNPCIEAFSLAFGARKAFIRGITFALVYNTVGIALAINGWVTPGVAAALMPMSSLIILMISTRWHGRSVIGETT